MAVANGLPHRNNVGHKVVSLKLEGPKVRADAPKTHLHLISNEDAPCLMDMPVEGQINESGSCQSTRQTVM